jgi:DNA-binding response OmpR family regulator
MRRMAADSFAHLVSQLQRLQSAGAMPARVRSQALHIIVVEDDDWYRDYLTDNLRERDFDVIGVADGTAFNAVWETRSADIVILDIELGAGKDDGLVIASRLLRSSSCGVVMVTAKGEMSDRLHGLGIGADAYFAKPVSIDELAITLTNLGRRLG